MTQRKVDELFSTTKKRSISSRVKADEFDDLFESHSTSKRRRTNEQPSDVFEFPASDSHSLKKKRSAILEEDNQVIDQLFNDDTRKKLRRPIKTEDVFDLFPTSSSKPPSTTTTTTQKKKIKMFFDPTDLESACEPVESVNLMLILIKYRMILF